MKKMNKKGFTLIEMLVVIAIIAVLVSIVIPVVGSATEKAKEAADAANIRSAIATITTAALTGEGSTTAEVKMTQANEGFVNTDIESIGGLGSTELGTIKDAVKGTTIYLGWANDKITVSTSAPTPTPTT